MNFGGVWHSDTTYLHEPPMASILYAIEIPPYGGDTLFSNQYMAFDTLSEGLKKLLSELVAANTSSKKEVSMTRDERMREAGMELNILSALHPVVRTHPETGIKALYVNKATPLISKTGQRRKVNHYWNFYFTTKSERS